jgi:hypothetical protein
VVMLPSGHLGPLRKLSAIIGRGRSRSRLLPALFPPRPVSQILFVKLLEMSYTEPAVLIASGKMSQLSIVLTEEVAPWFQPYPRLNQIHQACCLPSSRCSFTSHPRSSLNRSMPDRCLFSSGVVSPSSSSFSSERLLVTMLSPGAPGLHCKS